MTKFRKFIGLNLVAMMVLAGCGTEDANASAESDWEPAIIGTYEAESGTFAGNAKEGDSLPGFSGQGYAEGLQADGDGITILVESPEDGFYDLVFTNANIGGYKENYILVDGESVGYLVSDSDVFQDSAIERVFLSQGTHEVTVSKYWGYVAIDKLTVQTSRPLPADFYDVSAKLCNPNASDNAKRVMSYLCDNYGKNVISGQYCDGGLYGHEDACIWTTTGKFPAMIGLDMMDYASNPVENGASGRSIEYAQEAWEKGGVITMCWHWDTPTKYVTGNWYSAFYKEHTSLNLDKIMSGEDTEGYDLLCHDMDLIAEQFKILADEDVPVLWRPLHEASGGWFWWGNCKAESYIALYKLMYDKFVNEYQLNNLIWVWNAQSEEWYPGDEYVDIVGTDIYPGEHVYTPQTAKYLELRKGPGGNKLITLSENGCIFDPDLALRDGAMWSYIGTWGGEFIAASKTLNRVSEKYTEEEMLIKFYNHENVITLDELPDLKTYPIREEANGE